MDAPSTSDSTQPNTTRFFVVANSASRDDAELVARVADSIEARGFALGPATSLYTNPWSESGSAHIQVGALESYVRGGGKGRNWDSASIIKLLTRIRAERQGPLALVTTSSQDFRRLR